MGFPRTAVVVVGLIGAGTAACRGPGDRGGSPTPLTTEAVTVHSQPMPSPIDAGTPLAEAPARALLAERFRAHGFRVRYDVRIEGPGYALTVDGYDPVTAVGYEYVAALEHETDLVADERIGLAADRHQQILIVDPCDAVVLSARVTEFLAGLRSP